MDLESQNARDSRIERLWRQLDVAGKGELDLADLQKGLKKIDHPLQDARLLLQDVLKTVDTSGDGKIQYEEFRIFVEHTEKELLALFRSIDRDSNGKLDKEELNTAFSKAGLAVTAAKLDRFFQEVDTDHDGVISFEEWRNFLLFLPTDTPGLRAVFSYYSSTLTLNAEGDTVFTDENIQGLGITSNFLKSFFGSIMDIVRPPTSRKMENNYLAPNLADFHRLQYPRPNELCIVDCTTSATNDPIYLDTGGLDHPETDACGHGTIADTQCFQEKLALTWLFPDPGYFAAGGIAGVISRSVTAPLDRLKVYLIANTGEIARDSANAVKKGDAVAAAKHVGGPLVQATKELWKAGGMRSLFAGNGLNVVKVMPESAIKFGSYEAGKRFLAYIEGHGNPKEISSISQFIAGGMGGMVSQLFVYPLDTLKFRMQCNVQEKGLRGNALIIDTAKKMWAQGGIKSAYRGLGMGLAGMFPYSALDLATFEFLKGRATAYKARKLNLSQDHPDCRPNAFTTGAMGAFSGAFGASVVYPVNLIRTRLQAQGTVLLAETYDGVFDCVRKTVRREGYTGLFKGITPNLLKVAPAVSITYVVYEHCKRVFGLK